MESEVKFEGVTAFLDILGFSSYFELNDDGSILISLESIRDRVIGKLIYSAITSYRIVQHDFDRFKNFSNNNKFSIKLEWLSFSDSIILYLPLSEHSPFSSPKIIIESMTYTCSLLLAKAISLNIPLRGAISYGECLINHDPLYVIGKPFIEAHDLEKKQMWAGAALTDSALNHFNTSESDLVVEYDVPCKDGQNKLIVVNWPANLISSVTEGSYPDWDVCFNCSSKDKYVCDDVKKKKRNTMDFFIDQNTNCSARNVLFSPESNESSANWFKLYKEFKKDK